MNVWLNIHANSKLIALLNRRICVLSSVSDAVDRDDFEDAHAELHAIESAIVVEVHCLASEANLLVGGVQ